MALALRFISGKYQGGEFPLAEGQRIVIGRSSDLDMVLVEEMVSRRHAHIQMQNGIITIEDLGSTNGTFVNGEKIQRATLREGDRVLIGTSILKVVTLAASGPESRRDLERVAVRRVTARQRNSPTGEAPRMTGDLEEIPLPDLMQLFGTSRKTGVLVIRTDSRIGRIYLDKGVLHFAMIEGQPELPPLKSIFRMLGWRQGLFELDPPSNEKFEKPLDANVQEVLMEGFRQQDELNELRDKLPPPDSRLVLKTPLDAPLHELEPTHLDLLQSALNSPSLEAVFDRSPHTDLTTAQILMNLMQRGYLMAAPVR
jgi:pSer/pThr/pTyr-binding forkhead associated (FHA) protein